MDIKEENKGVLVDLDCLLDTRIKHLYNLNKDVCKKYLQSKKYLTRDTDNFDFISSAVFYETYRHRDKRLLLNPIPTILIRFITEFILETRHQDLSTGGNGIITIFVNLYPYILTDEESLLIKKAISSKVPHEFRIETIYKSNNDLEPDWVKENLSTILKYDGMDWLNLHFTNKNIQNYPIPDVSLIVPNIIKERLIITKRAKKDFLEDISQNLTLFIKLIFIDIKNFSIVL